MSERLEKLKFLIEKLPNVNESMIFLITELDDTQKAFDELDGLCVDLQQQNKRYREALEYIADNKIEHGWHLKAVNCVVRARKALEENRNG